MEKFNPNYSLEEFKNSNFEITKTAQRTALELEFDEEDIRKIVSTMESKHFFNSLYKIYSKCYLGIYVAFVQKKVGVIVMEKIHPETGEILHRDIRPFEFTFRGEKIIIDMPGWYPADNDDGIFTQEDMKVAGNALRALKARHKQFELGNVASA